MAKPPFFFYGTLMDADVRRAVLGKLAPKKLEPATLIGWRRFRAEGASFPIVKEDGRCTVPGTLAHDVSDEARRLLDEYEGPDGYAAERWVVETEAGVRIPALVYVPDGSGAIRPSKEPWELAEWQATRKPAFLARLKLAKTAPRE